ncbi:MAG: AarF/ABC1/UbiB kinase family protein [Acidobacteriota bacterium]|nr:AarF/ABC1/UbiB kinase family protein [Blastocatellia bacterium]MDW8412591.1 AarF/ABC1/UbiB kinase family protein [Acidobacteriota bacterium]
MPDDKKHLSFWHRVTRPIVIVWTLFNFLLYVYLDFKGWLGKQASREARLRRQARKLLERLLWLGPTFIKIGQALGTRADLLPIPYIDELSKLQDKVPKFPNEVAFAIVEKELGRHPQELFAEITPEPIAAASLGQVYHARLKSGQEVAIKVQRPNLEAVIAFDLKILRSIVRLLSERTKLLAGYDWLGMLDEFERMVAEETDYLREARNAERFKENFKDWKEVYVPRIYWEFCSKRVLTMEFIRGVKVVDLDALIAQGQSPKAINELMHRTYFKQLLEDGFFHADPHPGNLLVTYDGRLTFFDFGMVGIITPRLQQLMVSAFFHILERDFDGLIDDLIALDFLKGEIDMSEFRQVLRNMFERKIDLKLSEVNFKELTYEVGELMYKYPFTTPSSFTFIIRALMTLEGISIQTNPEFNFMEVARPYARDFLLRRETALLRQHVIDSLHDVKSGKINWSRIYNTIRLGWQLWASPQIAKFFGKQF